MLVKMIKEGREIDVNNSPQSIAALKNFGWELKKLKSQDTKPTKKTKKK